MADDPLGRFVGIWVVDFEFIARPGERPDPVCLVAREVRTNRLIRVWRDELAALPAPPFPVDENTLYVAFSASAELSCHLALGWPFPAQVLDAHVEFINLINGLPQRFVKGGTSQLAALAHFGLSAITSEEKAQWRKRILEGPPFSRDEAVGILDYCQTDVDGLAALLPRLVQRLSPRSHWADHALLRGRYVKAVARMEHTGVPIDVAALGKLVSNWAEIKVALIDQIRAEYPLWEGATFKHDRFEAWLIGKRIPWPRTEAGRLSLSRDTFKEMAKAYPIVAPIREVRENLSSMRLSDLAVGSDGRNRTSLFPFGTKSSRNAPSNSRFVFGPAAWLRALIRPTRGRALAYLDYSAQEVGVAAALSGDEALQRAYDSGDPYMSFAVDAGLAPAGATKRSHETIRSLCKTVVLATNYGQQAQALAERLDISVLQAKQLLQAHRRTYGRFWQWSQAAVDTAVLTGHVDTIFGWRLHVTPDTRVTSLLNHPMQSNGAEMLRLACIFAVEAGISVCAPVHDALLIEAPVAEIEVAIERTRACMARASRIVLGGREVGTGVDKVVRYPDRFMDARGVRVWELVVGLLERQAA